LQPNEYIQSQGIGENLSDVIGKLEGQLSSIADYIISTPITNFNINRIKDKLESFKPDELYLKRTTMLLGIIKYAQDIRGILDEKNQANLKLILGRLSQLFSAFKICNVFILQKGEIEHYYTQTEIDYLNIVNKDALFHVERDFLLGTESVEELKTLYSQLISIISVAVPCVKIDLIKHLKFELLELIHNIQIGIIKGEVKSFEDIIRNRRINYQQYSQILEIAVFDLNQDLTFQCTLKIKGTYAEQEFIVEFDHTTNASNFNM
jgi:hypothetical protein